MKVNPVDIATHFFPRMHLKYLTALFTVLVILLFWQSFDNQITVELVVPDLSSEGIAQDQPELDISVHEIRSGDNLSAIFAQNGLTPQELYTIVSNSDYERLLRAIQPGETLEFSRTEDGQLVQMDYVRSAVQTERFIIDGQNVMYQQLKKAPEYRTRFAQSTIDSSLFLSAQQSGMSDALTMELAQIFGWDIDFALDIRRGDQFSLIYQEKFVDGEFVGLGPILSARFINNGRQFDAIRFTDSNNYSDFYSPNGRSMRKAFLRTPVEFARISSHFSLNRKHPVLNTIRNHRGTDYAAPTGTPIRAAGDGKITTASRKGGFGNTIIIQHGQRYSTLYAHLSAYHRSVKTGRTVKQGQTIGYVGATGLATGPHLHYEFRVNGVAVNPVTAKLPSAEPVNKADADRFSRHAENMIGQLDIYEKTGFAPSE